VYDACVLYPAPLRDFLMWLALSGAFRARWSAQIHDEWKRNLLVRITPHMETVITGQIRDEVGLRTSRPPQGVNRYRP
jgi:hypothetical protein